MVNALIVQIADKVVDGLNAGAFSAAFTAARHWRPIWDLPALATLRVSVVPRAKERARATRRDDQRDLVVQIGVQQKLTGRGSQAGEEIDVPEVDALVWLVEEIEDACADMGFDDPPARCVSVACEPVADADELAEKRTFTSVLTLTFRMWR